VLCLDLDRFKPVNDAYGHPVGDRLLYAVAERLRSCVRDSDLVGRLGGDEFIILQKSRNQPQDAAILASRICEVMATPFDLGDHEVVVGASIGISIAPTDGAEPETLFKNADLALCRAKHDGRGRYRFFEPEMDARAQQRRELELELRKAQQLSQFELYFQPLLNLKLDEISGFEALLRWNHPERGIVTPTEFIPLVEEIGMIVPLGEWVIRTACEHAAAWPENTRVAVNLSPLQFRSDNLVDTVANSLAGSGLAANRLELEITESVLLQDDPSTLQKLHRLHDLGVRIAMDDFGTGYSSLSYLRSFPFDKIKIDRSFVQDLSEIEGESAIVSAVASMCQSLGISTTAEGVETEEQYKLVKAAGYNEIQGYLISQPQTAGDVARYFASLAGTADVA
jgi:diguanylate cyclase (GGDEF)-like protein